MQEVKSPPIARVLLFSCPGQGLLQCSHQLSLHFAGFSPIKPTYLTYSVLENVGAMGIVESVERATGGKYC